MTRDPFHDELAAFGEQLGSATTRAEARRRRVRRAGGGLSVTVVAAILAVVAVPGASRLDPVAEARAALGTRGEILHFRVVWNYAVSSKRSAYFEGTNAPAQDVWATTNGPVRWRTLREDDRMRCNGIASIGNVAWVGSSESAYAAGRIRVYSPWSKLIIIQPKQPVDQQAAAPFPTLPKELGDSRDPAGAIRVALDRGLLRDGGVTEAGGRRLRVLTGAVGVARRVPDDSYSYNPETGKKKPLYPGQTIEQRPTQLTYTVDADTFAPVELRTRRYTMWSRAGGRQHYVWTIDTMRFQAFERLAPTAANRRLLDLNAPASTRVAWIRPMPRSASGLPKDLPHASKASMRAAEAAAKRCRAATR